MLASSEVRCNWGGLALGEYGRIGGKLEGGQTTTSYGALPPAFADKNGCILARVRSSHILAASSLPTKTSIARVSEKYPLENPSFLDEFRVIL